MNSLNVTEPHLPPLDEYVEYLKGIWQRNWLTNQGELQKKLEQKLQAYHQVTHPLYCVANGSLGLQIALKALSVSGEVITTPFSYVATTSCPLWIGCSVKFADIEPDTLTIDPRAVEAAITPQTEAILATHVFGNPCDVEALEGIAERHGLALIFDAAHAFGVRYKGKSILDYGDASMVSLHATKLMHTAEGGFVMAKDPAVAEKMGWMRRFGHNGPGAFHGVGMNAKMSELHAAMGLCNMQHVEQILAARKTISDTYDATLRHGTPHCDTAPLGNIRYREEASRNYSYYPVLFGSEATLLAAMNRLATLNISARRYFHPTLDQLPDALPHAGKQCSLARSISNKILCLPISTQMTVNSAISIANMITKPES